GHPSIVERFVNEARASAKLQHPNLIPVYDVAQDAATGSWFMALEYLQGMTVGQWLVEHPGPVDPLTILRVLAPVASCLKLVHAHGAIHRDLKPENLFLINRDGNDMFVIVLDLGVAHLSEGLARTPLTREGSVLGTPVYMAPEQMRGQRVTGAADTYAIGVIAYVMATGGWFPYQFPGETQVEYVELREGALADRQRDIAPIDPRKRVPSLPGTFVDVLMRALAMDPSKRPSPTDYVLALANITPGGLDVINQITDLVKAPATPAATPQAHTLIASASKESSRYEILERLGAGGMGEVYLGRHVGEAGFEKVVAIKRVRAAFSDDAAFGESFIQEAKLASRLQHENIVSVTDFSRDAEGRLFLVMEAVDGRDLAAVLATGPLPASIIIYIMGEMCRGLGYAHVLPDASGATRGLVHRDVSPQNCLLSFGGAVKVSDFGLAKAMSTSGNAATGVVRGKISYLSPEQANAESLDGRSDLFALGTVLYEMLTHRPLFVGTAQECIAQILFKPIPSPQTVFSRAPDDLSAIAMRLLARDRAERYQTAEDVLEDLLACADAPRNGRRELAALLAERFPEAAARHRHTSSGGVKAPRGLVAQQIAVPVVSTLGDAASQSVPRVSASSAHGRGRWIAVLAASVAVVAGGAFVVAQRYTAQHATVAHDAAARIEATRAPQSIAIDAAAPREPIADASFVAAVAIDAGIAAPDADVATSRPKPGHRPIVPSTDHSHDVAPASAPTGWGELAIFVHPYAEIWIDGQPQHQTPFREKHFPAGKHKLRLFNEDLNKDETTMISVPPDQTTTIERSW
ncbi:MAG TPA: protein kinase, partial [Kofleriaceae bacterium]